MSSQYASLVCSLVAGWYKNPLLVSQQSVKEVLQFGRNRTEYPSCSVEVWTEY